MFLILQAVLLSTLLAEDKEIPINVFDKIIFNEKHKAKIIELSKKEYNGNIQEIYVGQLRHPGPDICVKVHFKGEAVGSYLISRTATYLFFPNAEKEFSSLGLKIVIKRIFKLDKISFDLELPDEISYEQASKILKSIESNNFIIDKNILETYEDNPIKIEKIAGIGYDLQKKLITITTKENRFAGNIYYFMMSNDSITLLFISSFIS